MTEIMEKYALVALDYSGYVFAGIIMLAGLIWWWRSSTRFGRTTNWLDALYSRVEPNGLLNDTPSDFIRHRLSLFSKKETDDRSLGWPHIANLFSYESLCLPISSSPRWDEMDDGPPERDDASEYAKDRDFHRDARFPETIYAFGLVVTFILIVIAIKTRIDNPDMVTIIVQKSTISIAGIFVALSANWLIQRREHKFEVKRHMIMDSFARAGRIYIDRTRHGVTVYNSQTSKFTTNNNIEFDEKSKKLLMNFLEAREEAIGDKDRVVDFIQLDIALAAIKDLQDQLASKKDGLSTITDTMRGVLESVKKIETNVTLARAGAGAEADTNPEHFKK